MVDRIGERRRCADNPNLADALRTKWVDQPVPFRNHDDVNLANVGVHGNHVVSQVGVDVSGCPGIYLRLLVDGGADAPDHAAHVLAMRGARVENSARCEGSDHSGDADFACPRMNAYFDELRAECELDTIL